MSPRVACALAITLSVGFSFSSTFNRSVWRPDEPRVAEIGRAMLESGDYLVPRSAGRPFLEKPPLYWWGMTGLYRVFGISDGVARSTSSIACLALLLLGFDLARRLAGPTSVLLAGLLLGSASGFCSKALVCRVDAWLALFVFLGYWGFVLALHTPSAESGDQQKRVNPWGVFTIYLAAGLAVLTKGPVGVALIALPIVVTLIWLRRWNFFRSWSHLPGAAVFLTATLFWPVALYARGGRALLDGYLVQNFVYRVVDTPESLYTGGHKEPWWYYLERGVELFIPWGLALPAACWWILRREDRNRGQSAVLLFLISVLPLSVLMLSVPATKRALYLLPALAPVCVALAVWLDASSRGEDGSRIDRLTRIALLGYTVALPLSFGAMVLLLRLGWSNSSIEKRALPAALAGSAGLWIALIALALLLAGLHGIRIWRRTPDRTGIFAAGVVAVQVLAFNLVYYPLVNPYRDLSAIPAGLTRLHAFERPLIAFRVGLTIEEIIPLYTGRRVENLHEVEDLSERLGSNPDSWVLIARNDLNGIPREIRARLRLVEEWDYQRRAGRFHGLYRLGDSIDDSIGDARKPEGTP